MDWWVYEYFLLKGGDQLRHSLKWLIATTVPCEKIEVYTIVTKVDAYIKWNKSYCAF